jgi:hypothetical protein
MASEIDHENFHCFVWGTLIAADKRWSLIFADGGLAH